MTQAQMQRSENMNMFNSGGMSNPNTETMIDSYQPLDPVTASLGDYNRSMLQYTQRQMSTFVDTDDSHHRKSSSSRSSQSSGQSGRTSVSGLARQANGPPTSINHAAQIAENKVSGRDMATKSEF
ncbi:uncharacterized protein N7511_000175 [Penicillium nucicola]|uniref:uncharacterized protein n=1 Tax=Penicillium nucicola TaxID=1850975 RepID=UPI0025456B3B|nr:uncharacterized protein N7511_000175 [Penicillium nucicola]KAJ5775164.1 hypothetical protein N7511_000175 [Penicillium nucicola]